MRTRTTSFIALFQLILLVGFGIGRSVAQSNGLLQKYASDELFVAEDPDVLDVSGKWIGTEVQYDETGSFVKIKFDIVFDFVQEGNRVTGTSYIKDKLHEDIGYMNIRGYVLGDKLHFEEYELTSQKWETPNRVWCFRTGELDISKRRGKMELKGDYDSYAAYDYHPCRDYCRTVVQKDIDEDDRPEPAVLKIGDVAKADDFIMVAPSPFTDHTTLSYTLSKPAKVKLEVFDLSGRKVVGLIDENQTAGAHSSTFEAADNPVGSYIVRLLVDNELFTGQVVLMR